MQASGQEEPGSSPPIPFLTNLIATGFYSGYIPWASGTFGTVVGILIYLIPGAEYPPVLVSLTVLGFFVGVVTSSKVAGIVGHRLTRSAALAKAAFQPGQHDTADPSIVVIDEIVGIWTTLLFVPKSPAAIIIAFLSFRAFDIIKTPPARQLERIPRGWGIMLDDVIAGIYANISTEIALLIIRSYLPSLLPHG